VKDGTLLPLAEPLPYVADDAVFDVVLHPYGDKAQECTLYEDDGRTFEYRAGRFNWVRASIASGGKLRVERSGSYEGRRYNITGINSEA
jgi:alpha-D-xyloside xylohydrolase